MIYQRDKYYEDYNGTIWGIIISDEIIAVLGKAVRVNGSIAILEDNTSARLDQGILIQSDKDNVMIRNNSKQPSDSKYILKEVDSCMIK